MSATKTQDLQIPLVFGVTGHRDLMPDDLPRLADQVRSIFADFRKWYPNTPFVLLSPLAEGSDRLVARVALEPEINARLIVPLPMRKDLYTKDFAKPDSLLEFLEYSERAFHSFELDHLASDDEISEDGPARNRQYRAAGESIVKHCQVLIALWDGEPAEGEGGTAEIIALQTEGIPSQDPSDLEPPEGFPARWIITPHKRNQKPRGAFKIEVKYPALFKGKRKEAEAYYKRIFERMNEFNRNVATHLGSLHAGAQKSKSYVLGRISRDDLSDRELLIVERYGMADALAIHYQRFTNYIQHALHWLVFFTFVFFVLFAHLPREWVAEPQRWRWLVPSGLAFVFAGVLFFLNRIRKFDTNYQDFRAVAEGLRVAFFWRLAGISESVAEYYLRNQRSELDWIRGGLRGWTFRGPTDQPATGPSPDRLDFILKHWVNDQRDYFEKKWKQNEHIAKRNEWAIGLLVLAAVVTGVILFAWALTDRPPIQIDVELIVVDIFLAAGALWHSCNERMAYQQHAKQYSRMHALFGYASKRISAAMGQGNLEAARDLIHELGKQALAENGDWVLLHRERPVEVPHP
jgi:hypothetical protein